MVRSIFRIEDKLDFVGDFFDDAGSVAQQVDDRGGAVEAMDPLGFLLVDHETIFDFDELYIPHRFEPQRWRGEFPLGDPCHRGEHSLDDLPEVVTRPSGRLISATTAAGDTPVIGQMGVSPVSIPPGRQVAGG
jgi:hypothetical protein